MVKESFLAQFYGKSQNYTDIPNKWYKEYNVKKGLRNEDGTGVRIGLTRVADVVGYEEADGGIKAIPGRLLYRGVDVLDLVKGKKESHFGYEETCFLLLFGYLPKKAELEKFCNVVRHCYTIPDDFVEMNLLRFPGKNLMNKLQDAVLTLYNYDDDPDNTDVYQTLVKGVNLLAKLPSIACYAYQSKVHYYDRESLFIHYANPEYSIAENFLSLLRKDQKFTSKEANLLDTILMLHADHGGGNNSTFTTHVVTSSGSDTYSVIAAALASLKGPKHGGANIKVVEMMADLKRTLQNPHDEGQVADYLHKLLNREAFDRKGLIYGMGHAVYSISDPRATIFRGFVERLAREKDKEEEFSIYAMVERMAPEIISRERKIYKGVSPNVDFYSGLTYSMLGIPEELFTPIFAIARIVGWSAHRLEELINMDKIIRPAYMSVQDRREYVRIADRG